jgi:hypothetical protein
MCTRLDREGLPTSVPTRALALIDNSEGGWSSEWHETARSSLAMTDIAWAVRDDSVPHRMIGLRDQLFDLAVHLDQTTQLGEAQQVGLFPGKTGAEAILLRTLVQFAWSYLTRLADVRQPDDRLLDQMCDELDQLVEGDHVIRRHELVVSGVNVSSAFGPYRDVTVRPLTGRERGTLFMQTRAGAELTGDPVELDFVVPQKISFFEPTTMFQVRTRRRRHQQDQKSSLPDRVALALFLEDYEIGSAGVVMSFEEPRWASMGTGHVPLPVEERVDQPREMSEAEFHAVVDLAHKIPHFAEDEGGSRAIALHRLLRGCGASRGGLIDLTIALEAALLQGIKDELRYRFALYGALFLRAERDPLGTMEDLKKVYDVRSSLVHGSRVNATERNEAEGLARELAKRVLKRAVDHGWPDHSELNRVALTEVKAERADAAQAGEE